jgi:hypothetical protein
MEEYFDEDNYYIPENKKDINIIIQYKDSYITKNIRITDGLLPDDFLDTLQESIDTITRE